MFQCFSKTIFLYCSQFHNLHVNTTAIHKVNKDLNYVRYAFPTSELLHSKGFMSGSLKISSCDHSYDHCVFLVYRSNKCYMMMLHLFKRGGGGCSLIFLLLNVVFILGQPLLKGSICVRAALIEINTNSNVSERAFKPNLTSPILRQTLFSLDIKAQSNICNISMQHLATLSDCVVRELDKNVQHLSPSKTAATRICHFHT